ncbi:hypothetical protein pdam_00025660, partial [Pocillopora damicornis]
MSHISTIRSSATIIGVGTGYSNDPVTPILKKYKGRQRTVLLADAPINDGDVEVNTSSVARWPRKQAAINPNLNLFTIPPTDLSTASYRYVKVPPQTASITPIHKINYIYLERSFVKLYLGFKTTGNANLTSRNDTVNRMTTPANNLAHTLFKQVNFPANGTLLTGQEDMYNLKAYIQTVLNYDRDDGETILQPTVWRNEIDLP